MDQYLKVFRAYNNRRRLSPELSSYLQQHALCFSLKARENLVERDQNTDMWYFIEKGIMRYYMLPRRENFTYRFKSENEFMLFDNNAWEKRNAELRIGIDAVTDAVLWSIPGEVIRTALLMFPEFKVPHTNAIWKECDDSDDFGTPREYKSIRYEMLHKHYVKLIHRLSIEDMASFVCVDANQLEAMLSGKTKAKLPFRIPLPINRGNIRRR